MVVPEGGVTEEDVDAHGLHGVGQVASDGRREVLGVSGDALALELDVVDLDAEHLEVVGVAHVADAAGGGEERLGGDAAAVHACAADDAALDDGSLEAALHRVERGAVAADARADDDEVVVVIVRGDLHGHRAVVRLGGDARATVG